MKLIKNIIFDLDGTLINSKKIHNQSLLSALKYIGININTIDSRLSFDGLSTIDKVKFLSKKKGIQISKKNLDKILKKKQNLVKESFKSKIKFNKRIYSFFFELNKKYNLAIATNSNRVNLNFCINSLKIKKFIKCSYSINDVSLGKPDPEIFMRCLKKMKAKNYETLIIEDSNSGIIAAKKIKCNCLKVKSPFELDINYFKKHLLL